MNQFLKLGAAAALCVTSLALAAPGDSGSETRSVDAQVVRVKLDGLIDLKLKQGPVATLVVSGDKTLLSKTTTLQKGDTLTIDTAEGRFKMGRDLQLVTVELTLPALRQVTSDSIGTTDVAGFSGERLDLHLDGAGSMKVDSNYRLVHVILGGVGSMNIKGGNGEGVDLNLRGAGVVTLSGTSKWLKASLGGLGSLDAQQFHAETVNLDLSGLGNAIVSAKHSANLNVSGLGSVTVLGKPVNRSVSVDGLGKVSWR